MAGNFFKGTSTDQDSRFGDKERKLIMNKQWPEVFNRKLNMKNIDLSVIKPWIEKKMIQYIGIEDEVVQRQIINYLEQQSEDIRGPDPKVLSIQIMGYFEKNTLPFMTELWNLLVDAEGQDSGIPNQLLDSKKVEYEEKKKELQRLQERQKLLYQAIEYAEKTRKKTKTEQQ
ncbi:unnamed protein product [Paramecium sonneborni]|uniref:PWI domain-containing protein n=1 Tax=Paramecium sonneborni TaxID=65129 RepID=A0A8S1LGR8_9CILI|nr:unnamed protein product [Paramecium sonneborni]